MAGSVTSRRRRRRRRTTQAHGPRGRGASGKRRAAHARGAPVRRRGKPEASGESLRRPVSGYGQRGRGQSPCPDPPDDLRRRREPDVRAPSHPRRAGAGTPVRRAPHRAPPRRPGPDAGGAGRRLPRRARRPRAARHHPRRRTGRCLAARAGRRDRDAGRAARAGRAQHRHRPDDRLRLPRHPHPVGDPPQRAGEPGLVHRLHAVPARDQPGPARGAADLPDHGVRPDRAPGRRRVPARRGHRRRRGDDAAAPGQPLEQPAVRRRRRHAAADRRRAAHPRRAARHRAGDRRRAARGRVLRDAAVLPGRVGTGRRPVGAGRGRARARGTRRRRGGPAGPDPAHPARRARRGRRGRLHPALRGAARLRRPARGLPLGRAAPRPSAAGTPRRGLPRRRRPLRPAAGAADPRAAHPPGEGHVQHLHRAGAARGHGRLLRGAPRPGRAARHRHPHPPDGRRARRRAALGRRGDRPRRVLRLRARPRPRPGRRRRRRRARRRDRAAPRLGRRGRRRHLGDHHRGAPARRVGVVRRHRGGRGRARRGHRRRAARGSAPRERVPHTPDVPRVPVRDLADALAAPPRRRRPGAGPHDDPAGLVHDEAQRRRRDGGGHLAAVRRPAPARAGVRHRRHPGDDRPAGDLAGRPHRLRRGVAAAQRGQPGRARRAARHRRVPPQPRGDRPRRLPDPGLGARHQRRLGDHGRAAGGRRRDRPARRRRPRRPARQDRRARRPARRADDHLPVDARRVRGPGPRGVRRGARRRRPGLRRRRQPQRARRGRPPGGLRRRRQPPQPAQDLLHPARRRRPRRRPGRGGRAPGAVPARAHPGRRGRRRPGVGRPPRLARRPADLLGLRADDGPRRDAPRHAHRGGGRQLRRRPAAGALPGALRGRRRPGRPRVHPRPAPADQGDRRHRRRRRQAARRLRLPRPDHVLPGGRHADGRAHRVRGPRGDRAVRRRDGVDPRRDRPGRRGGVARRGQPAAERPAHRGLPGRRQVGPPVPAGAGRVPDRGHPGGARPEGVASGAPDRRRPRRPEPGLFLPAAGRLRLSRHRPAGRMSGQGGDHGGVSRRPSGGRAGRRLGPGVAVAGGGARRRGRRVPAASVRARPHRRRRRDLDRRRAARGAPQHRHRGAVGDRRRAGSLARPGGRAQADGRGVGRGPGRLGRAVARAATAAGRLRRGRRAGLRLRRAAGRGAVHRRGARRHRAAAGGAARAGLYRDRHRRRLAVPARRAGLPGPPGPGDDAVAAGVGGARGRADRGARDRLGPADRVRVPPRAPADVVADRRPGRRVRAARCRRAGVPAALRQRRGPGRAGLPRRRGAAAVRGAGRAEAAGDGDVPGQRRVRRTVHPDAVHRRGARGRARRGLVGAVAGHPGRHVRPGRGGRDDRGRDAGAAGRPRARAGADRHRVRDRRPAGRRDAGGDRGGPVARRVLDLLGAPGRAALGRPDHLRRVRRAARRRGAVREPVREPGEQPQPGQRDQGVGDEPADAVPDGVQGDRQGEHQQRPGCGAPGAPLRRVPQRRRGEPGPGHVRGRAEHPAQEQHVVDGTQVALGAHQHDEAVAHRLQCGEARAGRDADEQPVGGVQVPRGHHQHGQRREELGGLLDERDAEHRQRAERAHRVELQQPGGDDADDATEQRDERDRPGTDRVVQPPSQHERHERGRRDRGAQQDQRRHEGEEQPSAEQLGADLQVVAVRVAVVQDPELPVGGDGVRGQVEPGGQVVVIVGGHREQRHPGGACRGRGGEHVVAGQGHVLRVGDGRAPVPATQHRHGQREPDPAPGVGECPAADQPERGRVLPVADRVQAEDGTVEQHRLVERVVGLGQADVVDPGDPGPGGRCFVDADEVVRPGRAVRGVRARVAGGAAQEQRRAVRCGDLGELGLPRSGRAGDRGGAEPGGAARGGVRVGGLDGDRRDRTGPGPRRVDEQPGTALLEALHLLGAVHPGTAEPQCTQHPAQLRARGQLDERGPVEGRRRGGDRVGPGPGQRGGLGEREQRATGVDGRTGGVGLAEDVVEDLQRQRPGVPGGEHRREERGQVEPALTGEQPVVTAPGQHVHRQVRRVGELQEEQLLAGDVGDPGRVRAAGQDVEGVQAEAERGWSAARTASQEASQVGVGGGVDGVGGHRGAHQHGVGAEPRHDLEGRVRAAQVRREPVGVGRVDVAQRLVEVHRQAQVAAAGADRRRGPRVGEQVRREDLDAVEPGGRGGGELVLQRAGQADRDTGGLLLGGDQLGEVGEHPRRIRCDAGEQTERLRGLVHRHRAAVEGAAARGARGTQQRGVQRPVDDLGDPRAGREQRGVERQAGVLGHPHRCGVHEAVGAGEQRGQLRRRVPGGLRAGGQVRGHRRGERGGAVPVDVDDLQDADTLAGHGVGGRGAGAPGAQQHDPARRGAGQPGPPAVAEPGPVGVVPGHRPVRADDDGVDRADGGGVRGEGVEVADHALLAGMGDVESRVALGAGPAEQVADAVRCDPEDVEVEAPVGQIQAVRGALALVQGGRQRRTDAGADQPRPHPCAGSVGVGVAPGLAAAPHGSLLGSMYRTVSCTGRRTDRPGETAGDP
ncbi:hypothetical protein L7F22_025618 [Adiantum nelumboides]|nr:hypothetical protein [Adiantum nelumboides]